MKRRTRLEEGIYQDAYGLASVVKVGNVQREQRWPLGTDREQLRSWRIQKRAELDEDRASVPKVPRGTLQADGLKWIERKKGLPCYAADRSHLKAWFPHLGLRLRNAITREDCEKVIAGWRTAKVAVRTIRHRVRVLRELFQSDGKRTPVDDVSLGTPPRPEPKAVTHRVIQKVATALRDAPDPRLRKHYARFLVRATTGQRPVQIGRAVPSDVDLKKRIWYVRTSKGGQPIPLPLNRNMVQAWKVFIDADAWGAFCTSNAADVLHRHGWPKGIRPYDLRHTLAIDLLLAGADLGDVQGILGHTQIQTTRDHYAPILTARLRKVTETRALVLPDCQPKTASGASRKARK